MKSILQEASSVERAIDKAWNEAGKPKEFTIKILDQGERNFFGLTRRPAVVSILFKPEKSTYQQPRSRQRDGDRSGRNRNQGQSAGRRNDRSRSESSDRSRSLSRDRVSSRSEEVKNGWRDEWKKNVTENIRALLKLMGMRVSFTAEADEDKVLTVTFKNSLIGDEEEQRMLFASLSYLSIQFLKREYKNRFTGFRIVVTGPTPKKRAQKAEGETEVAKAAPAKPEQKKSSVSRGSGGRSQKKSGPARSAATVDDEHLNEQLKFAQQQLRQEEEVKQVFEEAVRQADSSEEKPAPQEAQKQEKTAPAKKSADKPAPVAKPEQAAPAKEPAKKSSKAGKKHEPFFVMPSADEGKKEG